jgi:N6-adenosine-specific RNA methylase IME4
MSKLVEFPDSFELKINPVFRDLIPPLADHELAGLEEDILHFGCQSPITTWKGFIIDGHHRYEICTRHKFAFKTEEKHFEKERDVRRWMIKNQFSRRNMTDFVRGELVLSLEEILREEAEENSRTSKSLEKFYKESVNNDCQNFDSRTRQEAQKDWNNSRVNAKLGKEAGISREQVRKIKKLKESCSEEEIKDLRNGSLKIHKKFTEKKRETKQSELKATEFPKGKYRVIYADPPWKYGDELIENYGGAEKHYPTMSLDSICEIPISQIADENAVLFLWATSPLIEDSFKVLNSWGFKYKTSFVWDKVKHNMGHYNSVRHEVLLVCAKGSCLPDEAKLFDSVQTIERTKHSEKPEEFREIIETLYKYGNKIELFARKKTEGWDVYGNECQ